jgi:hypothetical protein
MGDVIRLRLEGPNAEPGRIPASDVARLLQGYERALGRAAEARLRRQARTGRRGGAVETATRLIFRGIERGSLVAELELPEVAHGDALALDDDHLGELAAGDLFGLIENPNRASSDEWVVDALVSLGDDVGIGLRYSACTIEWQRSGASVRHATFTAETRDMLANSRDDATRRRARDDRVAGTLIEADFERHTAHVLTSDRSRVTVTFTEGQADEIQTWLRRPGELEGRIEYDQRSGAALAVELRRIVRPVQLQTMVDSENFFRHRSVDELVDEQGVGPVHDVEGLADEGATEEELVAFLDAIDS